MMAIVNETIKAGVLHHITQNKLTGRIEAVHPPPSLLFHQSVPFMKFHKRHSTKLRAMRRRKRADIGTETYVILEPGKDEEFISEEELKLRLKGWLENWPGGKASLPTDLARFENIDDAVEHLVKYVCELEIDGDVGSLQWYAVRLHQQDIDD